MQKIILILVSLVCGHTAQAGDVYVGQWSKHFKDKQYNESHKYLAYQRDKYIVAYFKNSYYKRSLLVGKKVYTKTTKLGEVGVRAGVVTGYERSPLFALGYWSLPLIEINFLPSMVSVGFRLKMR